MMSDHDQAARGGERRGAAPRIGAAVAAAVEKATFADVLRDAILFGQCYPGVLLEQLLAEYEPRVRPWLAAQSRAASAGAPTDAEWSEALRGVVSAAGNCRTEVETNLQMAERHTSAALESLLALRDRERDAQARALAAAQEDWPLDVERTVLLQAARAICPFCWQGWPKATAPSEVTATYRYQAGDHFSPDGTPFGCAATPIHALLARVPAAPDRRAAGGVGSAGSTQVAPWTSAQCARVDGVCALPLECWRQQRCDYTPDTGAGAGGRDG